MISEQTREEQIATGERLRAVYLVEQAGYTLGLAERDGPALTALLPDGFLGEVRHLLDRLNAEHQNRALTAAESKDARREHIAAFAEANAWRRTVSSRATLARRLGRRVPDGLVRISSARSAPELAAQMVSMVGLLEANLDQVPGAGAAELLAQGRQLADALQSADATQEVKRHGQLPEALARFHETKARLYLAVKIVNDAGHALHAGDPSASSRYNLSILHRHAGNRRASREADPSPERE